MIGPQTLHPEDVKAKIRKEFGSLLAFERAHELGRRSVTDLLMGRRRPAAAIAVTKLFGHEIALQSATADDSTTETDAHRQNAGAI